MVRHVAVRWLVRSVRCSHGTASGLAAILARATLQVLATRRTIHVSLQGAATRLVLALGTMRRT